MFVERCSYNKHFMVIAGDNVYKHFKNNLIILLYNFHARPEKERGR